MKQRSDSEVKKVTIKISSNELNAMEDFIMCELSEKEEKKYRKITLNIWQKLVEEFDANKF